MNQFATPGPNRSLLIEVRKLGFRLVAWRNSQCEMAKPTVLFISYHRKKIETFHHGRCL